MPAKIFQFVKFFSQFTSYGRTAGYFAEVHKCSKSINILCEYVGERLDPKDMPS
jgi:hypothetical protein